VLEETGVDVKGEIHSLGYIDYTKSKKRIHAWSAPLPAGVVPKCASWEVDKAEMFSLDDALKIIHRDQATFLERLAKHLLEP
jgi:predicted NUDIX family NTP pyrophosphohydrolase